MNSIVMTVLTGILVLVLVGFTTLVVRALLKYTKSKDVRKEKAETRKTLGEAIKEHRTRCKMTQEFIAEALGVSSSIVFEFRTGITVFHFLSPFMRSVIFQLFINQFSI